MPEIFLADVKNGVSKDSIIRNYFYCKDTILKNESIFKELCSVMDSLYSDSYEYQKELRLDSSEVIKVIFYNKNRLPIRTRFILLKKNKIMSINPIKKDEEIIMWYIPCEVR